MVVVRALQRLEEERPVISTRHALEDPTGEPVVAVVENRNAIGPLALGRLRELVDLVAGRRAEELIELDGLLWNDVNGEDLCLLGNAERVVLVRQADDEPDGVDAALGRESDQAARELIATASGDDEHRVVEVAELHRRPDTTQAVARRGLSSISAVRPSPLTSIHAASDISQTKTGIAANKAASETWS